VSQQTSNHSFDELTRGLASGSLSRGKALRLMGGLLVASALGSLPGVAWANDDDDRCPQGQTRCGERCVNLRTNERHCGSCRNRCRSNQTCCGGRCVNLQRNENNCGACGNRCPDGQECVNGGCEGESPCPPEPTSCCSCVYRSTTTDEFVSTCHTGVPDSDACLATCEASVPPGSALEGYAYTSDENVFARCVPATGGVTGTTCDIDGCTAPPTP
jgi:Stigma-specific protein, Stig1